MVNKEITLKWSKLLPLVAEEINKVDGKNGVYRISRKESDDKFYVIFVGSTTDLKFELLEKNEIFLKQGGEFAFRYAEINDEEEKKSIEKQMYKKYAPEYNSKEPISLIDVKVNLN